MISFTYKITDGLKPLSEISGFDQNDLTQIFISLLHVVRGLDRLAFSCSKLLVFTLETIYVKLPENQVEDKILVEICSNDLFYQLDNGEYEDIKFK